jgi:putative ABC transport system substrate-binding protein
MAVEVLNGAKPGDLAVRTMSQMDIYLNSDTAAAIGVTIPADVLKEAAQVFSSK